LEGVAAGFYDDDGPGALPKEIAAILCLFHSMKRLISTRDGSICEVSVVTVVVATEVAIEVVTAVVVVVTIAITEAEVVAGASDSTSLQTQGKDGVDVNEELYSAGRGSPEGTGTRGRGRRSQGPT